MLFDPGCATCGCPTPGTAYRVRITSCSQPLPGVVVDLYTSSAMAVLRGSETTDSGGYATFYLTSGGSAYAHVPSPGSARINPGGSTVTLSTTTPPVVALTAATGYTCCYSSCGGSHRGPTPLGPITATTSGGHSWTYNGCNWSGCVDSDVIPIATLPETKFVANPSNPAEQCPYNDDPLDLTTGVLSCGLQITRNVSGTWLAGIAAPPSGGYTRREPRPTYMECYYFTLFPPVNQYSRNWYKLGTSGSCSGPFGPHSATGVVVSCDPLVVTFNFWTSSSYAWERTYPYPGTGPLTPPPVSSLTLVGE